MLSVNEQLTYGPPVVPPPVQLFLELTTACNLRCKHCYISGGEGKTVQIKPLTLHLLLRDFQAIGGGFVTFSGGEPTLHSGWRSAVRYARYLGLETTLLTNAVNLSASDIRFILDFDVQVALSMDGAARETHDAVRGQGSFERTLAVARTLCAKGKGSHLTICFTPMAHNFRELPDLVALANNIGASRVYLSLLENRGRALDNLDEIALTREDKESFLYSIYSANHLFPGVAVDCTNLRFFVERLEGLDIGAEDLDRTIRVTAKGEVFLTAYLDNAQFNLGSYEDGNLDRLWYSEKTATAFYEASRRGISIPQCNRCEYWDWCRAGSAALAWARGGSFLSVDGYCEAKKSVVKRVWDEGLLWNNAV